MKKLLLVVSIFICLKSLSAQDFGSASISNQHSKLGFISQLVFNKGAAEQTMIAMINDTAFYDHTPYHKITDDEKKKLQANAKEMDRLYNNIRLKTDQLLLQLSADMIRKNGKRPYKLIDNSFKSKGNTTGLSAENEYRKILDAIDKDISAFYAIYHNFKNPGAGAPFKALLSVDNILSMTEQAWTIIASARDAREKKVAGITGMLDKLRLNAISDLGASEEKEEKK
jgi:hypothetical protein